MIDTTWFCDYTPGDTMQILVRDSAAFNGRRLSLWEERVISDFLELLWTNDVRDLVTHLTNNRWQQALAMHTATLKECARRIGIIVIPLLSGSGAAPELKGLIVYAPDARVYLEFSIAIGCRFEGAFNCTDDGTHRRISSDVALQAIHKTISCFYDQIRSIGV